MYFSVRTIGGHQYLRLMESVYVKGKNPTSKVIKNYGRLDMVPEEIRKQYESEKQRKGLAKKIAQDERQKLVQVALTAAEKNDTDEGKINTHFNRALELGYGHLAVKPIWDNELDLRYKIGYLQKANTSITSWRLNDVLFYLCATKMFSPSSYLKACENKSQFIYCPWNDVAQDNFYRALDFVYKHKDALIQHAVKSRNEKTKTTVKIAFFDCTNTWFETPYDDVTWQIIRFTRKVRQTMFKHGCSEEEIEHYLQSEEFASELAQELQCKQDLVLRMRGKSKEGRFAEPIVTVALAIDQTGFPIDCQVFAGNLNEMKTIEPMLRSLKKKYSVTDIYFVADRGLNSAEGLDKIKQQKLGFVVAQKVSNQKASIRKEMLNLSGYKNCHIAVGGDFCVDDGAQLRENAFRFKVCDHEKVYYDREKLEAKQQLKAQQAEEEKCSTKKKIQCKIVYTFSPERRARDLADLEKQIAKASQAVKDKLLMGNACVGWRSLVATQKEAAENKEDKEQYRAVGLKEDVIENRRQIAGYAAVVFSHPEGDKAEKLTDEQVLSTYHRLVAIEDCFRTMKSNFSIRPMHVWTHDRVVAHCYLCVLALMMMKSLQEKLATAGTPMTSENIAAGLDQAVVVHLSGTDESSYSFMNVGRKESFHKPAFTGKGVYEQDENETVNHDLTWKAYEQNRMNNACDTDLILRAVGLEPLDLHNTLGEIKRRLHIHSVPNNKVLADEVQRYIRKSTQAP